MMTVGQLKPLKPQIFVEYRLHIKIFEREGYHSTGRESDALVVLEVPAIAAQGIDLNQMAAKLVEEKLAEVREQEHSDD